MINDHETVRCSPVPQVFPRERGTPTGTHQRLRCSPTEVFPMTTPKRVQLRRIKGWRKPDGAISVARPHKWGNLFVVSTPGIPDAETAVRLYRQWLPGTRDY
jgi:Domain of unknown function (DUF4326)